MFFDWFCRQSNERREKGRRHIFFGIKSLYKTTLQQLTIKMSSAHTENLPADLNEHNEDLADGCDNADTYLSAFFCSFSLF